MRVVEDDKSVDGYPVMVGGVVVGGGGCVVGGGDGVTAVKAIIKVDYKLNAN